MVDKPYSDEIWHRFRRVLTLTIIAISSTHTIVIRIRLQIRDTIIRHNSLPISTVRPKLQFGKITTTCQGHAWPRTIIKNAKLNNASNLVYALSIPPSRSVDMDVSSGHRGAGTHSVLHSQQLGLSAMITATVRGSRTALLETVVLRQGIRAME